jgi:hypothetical protein
MTLAEIMDEDKQKRIIDIMNKRNDNNPETQELVRFLVTNNVPDDLLIKADTILLKKFSDQIRKKIDEMRDKSQRREQEKNAVSCYEKDGTVYEEIIREDGIAEFVGWDENNMTLDFPKDERFPVQDDVIKKGAVLLPSGVEEYENEEKLVEELKTHIKKYLDIEERFLYNAVYYIILTWVYDKLHTIPYLRVLGDTGTGKSRFLDVIGRICYKPIIIAGTITPAPIYRLIERWRGTLLIDEADRRQSDSSDEIIKILNCGYEQGKPVIRCDKEHPETVEVFDAFCPKVISTRYSFYDKALESRCITYKTQQTRRKDIPPLLPPSYYRSEKNLRNKLLLFRLKNWKGITQDILEDVSELGISNLEPRLKQTATPFLVLFRNPKLREEFINFLKEYQIDLINERAESDEGLIVMALKELKEEGRENITPADITNQINLGITKDRNKFDNRKVGRLLKSLKIGSKTKRIEGKTPHIIEVADELWEDILMRYDVEAFEKGVSTVSNVLTVASSPQTDSGLTNQSSTIVYNRDEYNNNVLIPHSNETNETNETNQQKDSLLSKTSSPFVEEVVFSDSLDEHNKEKKKEQKKDDNI